MYTTPKLPYKYEALEPYIDAETMTIHHDKHHVTYTEKLNKALADYPELAKLPAEDLLKKLGELPDEVRTAVRNNGGGHVNHAFFWPLLKKDVEPEGPIIDAIEKQWKTLADFKKEFAAAAASRFGSGWAWLVVNGQGELAIMSTANQDSPLTENKIPLLCIDVWEHAYYLKYRNKRPDYIHAFWKIVNWEQVNKHFEAAKK